MSLKILLADDNMTAQNAGRKILSDAGYSVVAVSNGAAALKKFASEHPDILVLDVFMPGYSGLEVCEKLKAESAVPVLLSFSRMEPFRPEDGDRVRADGYVAKPFDATELLEAVARLAGNLSNGQQQSARASGVAAEITTGEYTEPSVPAQSAPATEFSIETAKTTTDGPSAAEEPSVALSSVSTEAPQAQSAPVAELSPSTTGDSWGFDRPSGLDPAGFKPAKFEPDGDAAKIPTPDNNEAGFFAFRSRTLFTAAAVEHFQPAEASTQPASAPTKTPDNEFAANVTSNSTGPESDASAVAALLSSTSLPSVESPVESEETASNDAPSVESWWKSSESSSDNDLNAALAAAEASTPTPAADLNFAAKDESPTNDDVAHEADQPADFHSVLAQLLPTTASMPSQSTSESNSGAEWPVTEAIMGFDSEHDIHSADSEPGLSFETLTSPVDSVSAEPSLALEPSQAATTAAEESSSSNSSSHVSEAIERVLGRFKESLLSEVMRELNTK